MFSRVNHFIVDIFMIFKMLSFDDFSVDEFPIKKKCYGRVLWRLYSLTCSRLVINSDLYLSRMHVFQYCIEDIPIASGSHIMHDSLSSRRGLDRRVGLVVHQSVNDGDVFVFEMQVTFDNATCVVKGCFSVAVLTLDKVTAVAQGFAHESQDFLLEIY